MNEYQEVTQNLEIPVHAGVEGFLAALRQILRLPRVTNVNIDANGKVSYTRFVRQEEPRKHVEVDFDSVSPSMLVRNIEVQELDLSEYIGNASVCIAAMFSSAAAEQMFPVAFVTGAATTLFQWHRRTTGVQLIGSSAYGLPVHRDRFIPDEALILTCAFARGGGLIDARKSYKITMPGKDQPMVDRPAIDVSPQILTFSQEERLVLAAPPSDKEVKVIE
jgi:hypothetical protein